MRLKTYNETDNRKYFLTFLAEDMVLKVPRQAHWGENRTKTWCQPPCNFGHRGSWPRGHIQWHVVDVHLHFQTLWMHVWSSQMDEQVTKVRERLLRLLPKLHPTTRIYSREADQESKWYLRHWKKPCATLAYMPIISFLLELLNINLPVVRSCSSRWHSSQETTNEKLERKLVNSF